VLHDINLDVRRGETVGIMGRNGAGKTTLLGILGNVIQPTTGVVDRYGRIATLLGLTAGFNPHFTGRENAYLFCSIQGVTRKQTDSRMDAIETFADIGRFFNLPLRTYSSGMQARLAFACAVHVDADLIIIDETLAVGDANFKMKCYDRIMHMKREGQTFLLVSHSPNVVANFCTRGVVLEGGAKVFDGPAVNAVAEYKRIRTALMGDTDLKGKQLRDAGKKTGLPNEVVLTEFNLTERVIDGHAVGIISAILVAKRDIANVSLNFGISTQHGIVVCVWDGVRANFIIPEMRSGEQRPVEMCFGKYLLPGTYFASAIVSQLIGEVAKPQSLYQHFMSFDIAGDKVMAGIANLDIYVNLADRSEILN
jgi:ABC-type polysaccharide/polyol phosphate transport system ATPase subunit